MHTYKTGFRLPSNQSLSPRGWYVAGDVSIGPSCAVFSRAAICVVHSPTMSRSISCSRRTTRSYGTSLTGSLRSTTSVDNAAVCFRGTTPSVDLPGAIVVASSDDTDGHTVRLTAGRGFMQCVAGLIYIAGIRRGTGADG